MFIADTQLSDDKRPIYDQIMDKSTPVDLLDMYWFSVIFVLTCVTSVGYGTNVYQTQFEYLFVIALEVLSFAVLAILITGIKLYESLNEDNFKFLLTDRLEETTVWLRKL